MSSAEVSEIFDWGVYLTRFMVILWGLIIPIIGLFCQLFLRELRKHKDVIVFFPHFSEFKQYKYALSNLEFIFCISAFTFNTIFFGYGIVDIHIFKLDHLNQWIGLPQKSKSFIPKESSEQSLLGTVIFPGYILNSIFHIIRIHNNLYRSGSYFSDHGREFMNSAKVEDFVVRLKVKHPRLHGLIKKFFFNFE